MKLGEATPRHNVLLVNDNVKSVAATQAQDGWQKLEINFYWIPSEKTQLQDQISALFVPNESPLGQTQTVNHLIPLKDYLHYRSCL